MPVKKRLTVLERADLFRPYVDHKKEIAALRKSLRWAMKGNYSMDYSKDISPYGHCSSCKAPGRARYVVYHEPDCLYAVARKLARLSVKVKE